MSLARLSEEKVEALAALWRSGPWPPPHDFVYSAATPYHPPRPAPWAPAFFFVSVLHFYGLWQEDGRRFLGPVRGRVDGRLWTEEGFLWRALYRAAQEEKDFTTARVQAASTPGMWTHWLRSDEGGSPVPLMESHAALARGYGEALGEKNLSPSKILEAANAAADPLGAFVEVLSEIPGYREDPLKRKAFFLAFILSRRPEKFLKLTDAGWPPFVDRHVMRVALRWGLVRLEDAEVERALEGNLCLPPPVEKALRVSAYEGLARVHRASGRTAPETWARLGEAAVFCPEEGQPDCGACFFEKACDRRVSLRAPVVRTMNY